MKQHPDLIPVDEFGLTGPMLVVGRETGVASGAADLIGVDQRGEIIVVEFKTGPQNPDFRAALAQLMDYGAQLWKLPYASFDALVVGYFQGKHCPVDAPSIGCGSLKGAAEKTWDSAWNDEDRDEFISRVEANLAAGTFHYVVVAQRFTSPMERVANYLNTIGTGRAHFHLVEMIRFSDGTVEAFEARTLVTSRTTTGGRGSASLDQETFLARVSDESFRDALREIFEFCTAKGLSIFWGTTGISIKLATDDKPASGLSIAWVHPTGTKGWAGLTDLALGVDIGSAAQRPSVASAIKSYLNAVAAIPGGEDATAKNLQAQILNSHVAVAQQQAIRDAIAGLVDDASA